MGGGCGEGGGGDAGGGEEGCWVEGGGGEGLDLVRPAVDLFAGRRERERGLEFSRAE